MIKNVGLMLKQRSIVSTNLEAYVEPSTNVRSTYADLNARTNKCAAIMSKLQVNKGDRIILK